MKYTPPLDKGTLIRRYKRFLADIRLKDGSVITIHCPNTGSMKNCGEEGDEVWFSTSDNPSRKYAQTWEMTRTRRGHFIGINTGRANHLVDEAVTSGVIGELAGYPDLAREVRYGQENSRIDLLLRGHESRPDCFVEVKSVTLLESPSSAGVGYFPDAISKRGQKHLRELTEVAGNGDRAALVFCVQHSGIQSVRAAAHIDPDYAEGLALAAASGVEVLAYKVRFSHRGARIARRIDVELS